MPPPEVGDGKAAGCSPKHPQGVDCRARQDSLQRVFQLPHALEPTTRWTTETMWATSSSVMLGWQPM